MIVGQTKPSLDELAHFGVKGMKWGVTREEGSRSTLDKAARKEAKANIKKLRLSVYDKKYSKGFEISNAEYNKLSSKDLTVRKGTDIRRVTFRKDERFEKGHRTYVSYKPGDSNIYRAVMPTPFGGGGRKKYKTAYEATYKSLETLKSPSDKKRIDAFVDILDQPSVKLSDGRTVTGREFLKDTPYGRHAKAMSSQQLGLFMYKEFAEKHMWDEPLNTAYFEKIKKAGYNALVDDNDRGHLSKTPLIILNPNGSLKKTKVQQLTPDDINNAQRRLRIEN